MRNRSKIGVPRRVRSAAGIAASMTAGRPEQPRPRVGEVGKQLRQAALRVDVVATARLTGAIQVWRGMQGVVGGRSIECRASAHNWA